MILWVMEVLEANNIFVYALTVHKSAEAPPCDVRLFGAFKKRLNEFVPAASDHHNMN